MLPPHHTCFSLNNPYYLQIILDRVNSSWYDGHIQNSEIKQTDNFRWWVPKAHSGSACNPTANKHNFQNSEIQMQKGNKHNPAAIAKMSKSHTKRWAKMTNIQRADIHKNIRGKVKPRFKCQYCPFVADKANLDRWHNSNCHFKDIGYSRKGYSTTGDKL